MGDKRTKRANVLGVGIHAVDVRRAVEAVESAVESRQKGYVCVTGVHGVMEAQENAGLKQILNNSLLTVPDGMPTVWVGKIQGMSSIRRVFGPDLMREVCARSVSKNFTHFLYGGDVGVAEELKQALSNRFPGIRIVGTYTPPFRPLSEQEEEELIARVAALRPDITWVGLSTPKQEQFMARYIDRLDTTVMLGVGAAFDFHTGRIVDAPQWIKNLGLQWLHRLYQDPGRLWKRYLANNPKFLFKIGCQLVGLRKYQVVS